MVPPIFYGDISPQVNTSKIYLMVYLLVGPESAMLTVRVDSYMDLWIAKPIPMLKHFAQFDLFTLLYLLVFFSWVFCLLIGWFVLLLLLLLFIYFLSQYITSLENNPPDILRDTLVALSLTLLPANVGYREHGLYMTCSL